MAHDVGEYDFVSIIFDIHIFTFQKMKIMQLMMSFQARKSFAHLEHILDLVRELSVPPLKMYVWV